MIISEIRNLKDELMSLMELQRNLNENKDNSNIEIINTSNLNVNLSTCPDKNISIKAENQINSINPGVGSVNNINSNLCNNLNNSQIQSQCSNPNLNPHPNVSILNNSTNMNNSNNPQTISNTPENTSSIHNEINHKERIHKDNLNKEGNTSTILNNNENLPNIEQFFVFNNKFTLVDSDKNLWHLKKCKKYEEFTKTNLKNYNNKEENLFAFLEYYQTMARDNTSENLNANLNCNNVENENEVENQNGVSNNYYTGVNPESADDYEGEDLPELSDSN